MYVPMSSLHILSMWETICDARAEIGKNTLFWDLVQTPPPPPLPPKWKVGQILAL